jgi:diapolycopene oxygenase
LRLAARGWHVTICEQGAALGGKLNTWEAHVFRFDTGPSLITMPWVFEDLYRTAGSRMQDHFELQPIQPLCDYIYPDGTRFQYSSSMPAWLETVKQLESRDGDAFLCFMKLGAQLWEVSKHTFMARRPTDWFGAEFKALRHMPVRYGWGNYNNAVCDHFRSPYLRQLYNRHPTYVGSSTYESPATLIVIPYIEFAFGGWYPQGGLYRIVESLLKVARSLKVELRTNAEVVQIGLSNGRVKGGYA